MLKKVRIQIKTCKTELAGSFFDGGFRYILMILRIGALPSFSFLTPGLLPVWILTVLFSPLIYLPVRAVKRKFDKDPLVT